jgi:hypothetical protein
MVYNAGAPFLALHVTNFDIAYDDPGNLRSTARNLGHLRLISIEICIDAISWQSILLVVSAPGKLGSISSTVCARARNSELDRNHVRLMMPYG